MDAILTHCIFFCVDDILNGGEYIDSDGNITIADTDEQIKICHRDIAALRSDCNKALCSISEEINHMRHTEDIERYITEILSRCGTYSRTFYSADDLNFLQHHEQEVKNDRKRYNDLFNSYRYCLLDDINEFTVLHETGEQIKQYFLTGKPDLIKIEWELTEIVDFYYRLGEAIDAVALIGGVDFILLQNKCGIWICKEHDMRGLIERLGSGKRVRDLLANAAGTGAKPLPEHPAFALPPELDTPHAREYLNKAQEAGFLDERYQPTKGFTRPQMKLFAAYCAVACNIAERHWKVFENLWGFSGLQRVKEEQGSKSKAEAIAALFPPDIVSTAKDRFNLLV